MFNLTRFLTATALALAVAGARVPSKATTEVLSLAKCAHPTAKTDFVDVEGKQVEITSVSCPGTAKAELKSTEWVSVCGNICDITCNNDAGDLPPIFEDCDMIKKAINIMVYQAGVPDMFVVPAGGIQALTFGTCKFFFQNFSGIEQVYCYGDLSTVGSRAGSACYPPVFPLRSEGLCKAADGSWGAASAHSQQ